MTRNDLFNKVSGYQVGSGGLAPQVLGANSVLSENALDMLAAKDIGPGTDLTLCVTTPGGLVGKRENSVSHSTAAGSLNWAQATNRVTHTAHGMLTGCKIQFDNTGEGTPGTLPTGGTPLAFDTDYFVIVIDANTYELHTTLAGALIGTLDVTWTADDEADDIFVRQYPTLTEVEVITADDVALTSNVKILGSSGTLALTTALLNAGSTPVQVEINQQYGLIGQQYLGARYTTNGEFLSGGFDGYFSLDLASGTGSKPYPTGFTVAT